MGLVECERSVRARLLNDCRLLADYSRHVVEAAMAKDEKAVTNSLKGDARDDLLQLLNSLIGHLREVRCADDMPGDCEEARELELYALAALGEYIRRVGDPVGLAAICTKTAYAFLEALIARDMRYVGALQLEPVGFVSEIVLKFLTKAGHFQLRESRWLNEMLSKHVGLARTENWATRSGEWMRREVRGVEVLAKRLNRPPDECVDEYWRKHAKACELAALFPPSLRGYKSAINLRQKFLRLPN